tara:strand:- start:353 stop:478 length:126 start_codon:yes stop_codon:yes gene_type:complete
MFLEISLLNVQEDIKKSLTNLKKEVIRNIIIRGENNEQINA